MMDAGPVPLASDVAKTAGSFDLVHIVHVLKSSLNYYQYAGLQHLLCKVTVIFHIIVHFHSIVEKDLLQQ